MCGFGIERRLSKVGIDLLSLLDSFSPSLLFQSSALGRSKDLGGHDHLVNRRMAVIPCTVMYLLGSLVARNESSMTLRVRDGRSVEISPGARFHTPSSNSPNHSHQTSAETWLASPCVKAAIISFEPE